MFGHFASPTLKVCGVGKGALLRWRDRSNAARAVPIDQVVALIWWGRFALPTPRTEMMRTK
jgi:hypothetical protein